MSLKQTLNQSYTEMGVIGLGRLEEEYGNDCKHDEHVSNCAVSIGMVISSSDFHTQLMRFTRDSTKTLINR